MSIVKKSVLNTECFFAGSRFPFHAYLIMIAAANVAYPRLIPAYLKAV